MIRNLKTYLRDSIALRIDEIGSNVLNQHAEYQRLSKELQLILREIQKYVPPDQQQLVFTYEEKEQAQAALAVEIMYKQGLADGVYINRRLSGAVCERQPKT